MANIITARGERSLRSLIDAEAGTVARQLYTDPDIFDQEMEQIYGRCWLFLGHESQIPNPGDFVITRMGTEEVLLVRDRKDRQIHAFLNSCAHRGMKVCRYDQGNALVFTCPFHAWTYDTKGKLVGAAFKDAPHAYNGEISMGDWGLTEVAQLTNYYGTIWATWDPKAPSFEDYAGPLAEGIRYDCTSSDGEDNGIEVFTPFQKWRLPTNWKVPAFSSSTDLTHAATTHRSVNAAAIGPDRGTLSGGERHRRRGNAIPNDRYAFGDHNLGHGGNWSVYKEPGIPEYVDAWFEPNVDDYFRAEHAKKAKMYAERIMPPHGHEGGGHFCVFPNFIMDSWRWRFWHPHTVDVVERWSLFGVDKNAPKHVKDAVRHYVMRYNGPSGATESDDMENWNYVYMASLGAKAQQRNYYFANGLGNGIVNKEWPGMIMNGSHTEEAHRARFSRWLAFMEAGSWDDLYPVNKKADHRIW